jgi:recombination protein RecT
MPTTSLTERRGAIEKARGDDRARSRSVADLVRDQLPEFIAALPAGTIDAKRFVRIAVTLLRERPELGNANRLSLLGALMHAAQMGLEIGGQVPEYYLTGPFKMKNGDLEVVGVLGYRGRIALAMRDERVLSIRADVVREGDVFEHEYGDDEKLRHVPMLSNYDAPVVAAYAQAKLITHGGHHVNLHKVIGVKEIDAARGRSKAGQSGPWVTDYAQMARKTAVHRFLSGGEVPMQLEVQRTLALDERPVRFDVEAGEVLPVDDDDERTIEATASDEPPIPDEVPPPEPEAS